MKAAELRQELLAGSLELAWDQWVQLGVSGHAPPRSEQRAADPEALLLFTLEIARDDPRLFDEVLDWLVLNEQLVSVQRLRNLCTDSVDRALVEAVLDWSLKVRGRPRPAKDAPLADRVEPLFASIPTIDERLDESFARQGFARTAPQASGKSQPPRLLEPISFAFRLRRLLGIGVRAEVLRALLTMRAPRLSGRVITAAAGFAQRNVREGLYQLVEAGVVDVVEISDDRYYSMDAVAWAQVLGLAGAPDLPFHHDWIPTLRALTKIIRWLDHPQLDELSLYLRASQARTLVEEPGSDLRQAGVPLALYQALGPDYWDDFTQISLSLLRSASRAL